MDGSVASSRDTLPKRPCTGCGRLHAPYAASCAACGAALRRPERPVAPLLRGAAREDPGPNPWFILAVGALLAPALALLPVLQYVGWFLASLVHEIGHCAVAWSLGSPAYPAIRIDGHAAAIHGDQRIWLVVALWLFLAALAWNLRSHPRLRVAMGVLLVLHPLVALTGARDVLHLLAGHLAELAFAGLAFHRAFSGGFTESTAERITYAMVAWYLLGKNLVLDVGLLTSAAAREAYLGNGSFGLEQDFMRAARALGVSLSTVGALMLLLGLAVIPTVWALRRLCLGTRHPHNEAAGGLRSG